MLEMDVQFQSITWIQQKEQLDSHVNRILMIYSEPHKILMTIRSRRSPGRRRAAPPLPGCEPHLTSVVCSGCDTRKSYSFIKSI